MHTAAVVRRFWASMRERFGTRWVVEYGEAPSRAWTELITDFDQEAIARAFDLLGNRPEAARGHPPTHSEFQALLERAERESRVDRTDHTRGFWRSVILDCVRRELCELRHVADAAKLEIYIAQHPTNFAPLQETLDALVDLQGKNGGVRTPGLYGMARDAAAKVAATL